MRVIAIDVHQSKCSSVDSAQLGLTLRCPGSHSQEYQTQATNHGNCSGRPRKQGDFSILLQSNASDTNKLLSAFRANFAHLIFSDQEV